MEQLSVGGKTSPAGSIAQSASFSWKNGAIELAQPVIDSRYLQLRSISPNGQYACGTVYMDYSGLVYRINLTNGTTAICVPPAYTYLGDISPLFTSNTGVSTGILTKASTPAEFSYTSGDSISITNITGGGIYPTPYHYYFRNSSLAAPAGQSSFQILGSSANQKFAVGKSGTHGCVWNVTTGAVMTIDSDVPSESCVATQISDDGSVAVCEIQGSGLFVDSGNGQT